MKMITRKQTGRLLALALALAVTATAQAGEKKNKKAYTLDALANGIEKLEKKKVVLTGTIIGTCKSGCKMWIAADDYKEGDLYALVRAKDDAFKFDTRAAGKTARLTGFAVAKLMDYCAERDQGKQGAGDKCATPVDGKQGGKSNCADPGKTIQELTFFATKVDYGDS